MPILMLRNHTLLKLYLSYVRPHLEYLPHVWNPSFKGDIDIIESVQKYALRVCTKSWELSYDDLLNAHSTHRANAHQRRFKRNAVLFWQTEYSR